MTERFWLALKIQAVRRKRKSQMRTIGVYINFYNIKYYRSVFNSSKLFLMAALFISGFFVNGIKILSEIPGYERRYEFLRCMGMKKKNSDICGILSIPD